MPTLNLNLVINVSIMSAITIFVIYIVTTWIRKIPDKTKKLQSYTYDELRTQVLESMDRYVSASMADVNMSKKTQQVQEQQRNLMSEYIRLCCTGDESARIAVKEQIYGFITNSFHVDEAAINRIIPFNHPDKMTAREQMETLIYIFDQQSAIGFKTLVDRYGWGKGRKQPDGQTLYYVDEEQVRQTYEAADPNLNYNDKLMILVQMIYADTYGLGAIDTLNRQKFSIEEIQVGVTGITNDNYDYKQELLSNKDENVGGGYSKDSIEVLLKGTAVRLLFLSFESDNEMRRCITNLIKNTGAPELTIQCPEVSIGTKDNRRITVTRPPRTESYTGFVRKFDSAETISVQDWCKSMPQADVVSKFIRLLARCGMNNAYTGDMSVGKTTMERSVLSETRPDYSLRTIEEGALELNTRLYLQGRNTVPFLVTDEDSVRRLYNTIRKTTMQILCIGEVSSVRMAKISIDMSKTARQVFFTSHHKTTEDLIADLKNANLNKDLGGNYSDEHLAEIDALSCLGFNVHLANVEGRRIIEYVDEVIPDITYTPESQEAVTSENASAQTALAIRDLSNQQSKINSYKIVRIFEYDRFNQRYLTKPLSANCYEKAREYMPSEQYEEFCEFFEDFNSTVNGGQNATYEDESV